MTYLLDTCVLSKLRKIRSHPDPVLEAWFNRHESSQFYLSSMVIAEIQYGISRLEANHELTTKKMALEDWLYGELIPLFSGRILPIDEKVALTWGQMQAKCQRRGLSVHISDGLIAATALAHNLIVVTQNSKHFEPTGAKVFNPWAVEATVSLSSAND